MLTRNLDNNRIGVRIREKYANENENGKGWVSFDGCGVWMRGQVFILDRFRCCVKNERAVAQIQFS
jgi:hypothetical protein